MTNGSKGVWRKFIWGSVGTIAGAVTLAGGLSGRTGMFGLTQPLPVEPVRGSSDYSLEQARSQLSDLEQFPLFLPPEQGALQSADSQISPTALSEPSFSWIRDQVAKRFSPNDQPINLVEQWQAYRTYTGFQYVDVVVNEAIWEQLNYFSRYSFVLQFGTAAQNNGYHLRVFHSGDAINRDDALALLNTEPDTDQNTEDVVITIRSVLLRGAYFCASSPSPAEPLNPLPEELPACSASVPYSRSILVAPQ